MKSNLLFLTLMVSVSLGLFSNTSSDLTSQALADHSQHTITLDKTQQNLAGFLRGTFVVRCGRGHDDIVEGITRNHDCEKCGTQCVDEGTAYVVCPLGHATRVEGITESHNCSFPTGNGSVCNQQCRR